jgi:hypothetical protein
MRPRVGSGAVRRAGRGPVNLLSHSARFMGSVAAVWCAVGALRLRQSRVGFRRAVCQHQVGASGVFFCRAKLYTSGVGIGVAEAGGGLAVVAACLACLTLTPRCSAGGTVRSCAPGLGPGVVRRAAHGCHPPPPLDHSLPTPLPWRGVIRRMRLAAGACAAPFLLVCWVEFLFSFGFDGGHPSSPSLLASSLALLPSPGGAWADAHVWRLARVPPRSFGVCWVEFLGFWV